MVLFDAKKRALFSEKERCFFQKRGLFFSKKSALCFLKGKIMSDKNLTNGHVVVIHFLSQRNLYETMRLRDCEESCSKITHKRFLLPFQNGF